MRHCSIAISLLALITAGATQAQTLSVSLAASEYNGYNISCFGLKDGGIDATVTGGTPPYTYDWSNRATTEDLADVPAGYYKLTVMDADSSIATADITLTEPMALKVVADPYRYPNKHNISCHDCFNGSIDVTVYHGVPPYSYMWNDSATTEDRSGLGALKYVVVVTDANGCQTKSETVYMTQPERESWDMGGNAGTDPDTHYMGTSDSADFVLKSNGLPMLRFKSNGDISLLGSLQGAGSLYRGSDGALRLLHFDPVPVSPCALEPLPVWSTSGNNLNTCSGCAGVFGSMDQCPVHFVSNATLRMRLTSGGQLQLGQDLEQQPISGTPARLSIRQGWGNWLGFHRNADAGYWGLHNPQAEDRLMFFFSPATGDPIFNVLTLHNNGKVSIGDVNIDTDATYEYGMYLHKGLLPEKLKVAIKTTSEWSDHVFQPGYRLMPLKDVAAFIKKHGHLPNVPSADQMVEQGLDVVRTDAMLLEKIEEIMLHLIRMEERVAELEKENAVLRRTLSQVQNTSGR
jgi:hypothetical protein